VHCPGVAEQAIVVLDRPLAAGSVRIAPVTELGPPLVTWIVYVVDPPALTEVTPSVLVIWRSADNVTVSVSVALLFPEVGSVVPAGAAIVAMLGRHKISNRRLEISDLKRFVAGADVFSKQSDGSTVASQYAKLGIGLKCANTERVSGWAEVLHRLGDPGNGVPARLFLHERCARLLECLPSLQHDPNRPEDVLKVDADEDGVGGDDAADCLRYLVATKSRTVTQRKLKGL